MSYQTSPTLRRPAARMAFLLAMLLCATGAQAQLSGYFKNDVELDSMKNDPHHRTVWIDNNDPNIFNDPTTPGVRQFSGDAVYGNLRFELLRNRRALVGDNCSINKLINEVGLGSWTPGEGHTFAAMMDEDLNNYTEFNKVVSAGVTVNPVVSVRDMKRVYGKGTQAGFCIVASSGTNYVLTLDIIKAWSIFFYRDGIKVGSQVIGDGAGGEGITLSLIQIPGSEDASTMLTVTAPCAFDEVLLDCSGGVQVGVGNNIKIKYAFVGREQEYCITTNDPHDKKGNPKMGLPSYNRDHDGPNAAIDYVKGWNPVLLGIPFPWIEKERNRLIDDDLSNGGVCVPLIAVGYQGGAKFMCKDADPNYPKREVFPAGMDVGFSYSSASGLNLGVGGWIRLILFDRNGNKVQEETIKAEVLNLTVGSGGTNSTTGITADVPFSGAEIRFHTVLSVNLGEFTIHNAFVKDKPEAEHHCPIRPSAALSLCEDEHDAQLLYNPSVPGGVTWEIAIDPDTHLPMKPAGDTTVDVTSGGYVSGLFTPGEYTFEATAGDGICKDRTTIRYNMFGLNAAIDSEGNLNPDACQVPIINGMRNGIYAVSDSTYQTSGSLLSVSNVDHEENVVNVNYDDYAVYNGGLSVASNLKIIGVKRMLEEETIPGTDQKRKVRKLIFDGSVDQPKRVGFIIENSVTGIDLSALQFLQIRCYYHDPMVPHKVTKTYEAVISENNAVSAGIAGSDGMQKIRYCIELPRYDQGDHGNYLKVDEFQLWTSGVLNLGGSEMRIYYAFIEDAGAECGDALGCATEMLSYKDSHLRIDGEKTQIGSAISVATAQNDLSCFLDGDPETYMTLNNTVSAGGFTLALDLGRTVDAGTQLGIITRDETYLASVGVGDWLTAKLYYHGQPTGDEYTDWSVVGADVAGAGGKRFLLITPKVTYDEVVLEWGGVVDALAVDQRFYGLFLRGDKDHDGLPDCQDTRSCPVSARMNPACVDRAVVVKVTPGTVLRPGIINTDKNIIAIKPTHLYRLKTNEPGVEEVAVYSDANGYIEHTHIATTVGQKFIMNVIDADNDSVVAQVNYSVRPKITEWRKNATNNNWNNWNNWTAGIPYCCSDVIIPSDADNYPALANGVKDKNGDFLPSYYCCDNIHIAPRGRVDNTTALNYRRAWVEWETPANEYRLFSAPLKSMYTGDMFIPAADNGVQSGNYFMALNETTCEENRHNPSIYQRLWQTTAKQAYLNASGAVSDDREASVSNTVVGLEATKWTHFFNVVDYCYPWTKPVAIWVDNGTLPDNTTFRFRFPKEHETYHYYDDTDWHQLGSKPITRTVGQTTDEATQDLTPYRFIYERNTSPDGTESKNATYTYCLPNGTSTDEPREVFCNSLPTSAQDQTITLSTADNSTTNTFVMGNPFMGNIYLEKFLRDAHNQTIIDAIKLDHNGVRMTVHLRGNALASTDDLRLSDHLAPMEGMYIITKNDAQSIKLTLTKDMLRPYDAVEEDNMIGVVPGLTSTTSSGSTPSSAPKRKAKAKAAADEGSQDGAPELRLTATTGSYRATALLIDPADGEVESPALMDIEVVPRLAIFGLAASKAGAADSETLRAMDILPLADDVPLGIIAADTATVTIAFHTDNLFPRDEYYVYDRETGTRYWLDDDIVLRNAGTSLGRYILHRGDIYDENDLQTGIEDATTAATTGTADDGISVSVRESRATVRSQSADIASLAVYTAAGQLVRTEQATGRRADIGLTQGMQILRVRLADGRQHSYKIGR